MNKATKILEIISYILQFACAMLLGFYIHLYKITNDDLQKEKKYVEILETYIIKNEGKKESYNYDQYDNYTIIFTEL